MHSDKGVTTVEAEEVEDTQTHHMARLPSVQTLEAKGDGRAYSMTIVACLRGALRQSIVDTTHVDINSASQ